MKTIGSYEAKTHLPRLLEAVARGERFTITKHGVPVASLQPVHSEGNMALAEVIAELRLFRANHPLKGLTIREMISAGRR